MVQSLPLKTAVLPERVVLLTGEDKNGQVKLSKIVEMAMSQIRWHFLSQRDMVVCPTSLASRCFTLCTTLREDHELNDTSTNTDKVRRNDKDRKQTCTHFDRVEHREIQHGNSHEGFSHSRAKRSQFDDINTKK